MIYKVVKVYNGVAQNPNQEVMMHSQLQ